MPDVVQHVPIVVGGDPGLYIRDKPAPDPNIAVGSFSKSQRGRTELNVFDVGMFFTDQDGRAAGTGDNVPIPFVHIDPVPLLPRIQYHRPVQVGKLGFGLRLFAERECILADRDDVVCAENLFLDAPVVQERAVERFVVNDDGVLGMDLDQGVIARDATIVQYDVIFGCSPDGDTAFFRDDPFDDFLFVTYNDFGHSILHTLSIAPERSAFLNAGA